ncbi:MAG: transglycosylase, partial [Bradyrhizobium sp.]|nr:transglycosylase [Bradyrhizobium sp.]
MDPRRFAAVVALTAALAGCAVAWLAGFGPAGIENTSASSIEAPQSAAMGSAAVDGAATATPAEAVTATAARAASDEPESIAEPALTDPSPPPQPETKPEHVATASIAAAVPN